MPDRLSDSRSISLSHQEVLALANRLNVSPRQFRQIVAEVREALERQPTPESKGPDKPWDWWKGDYRPLK
jgi:hypothetical protein